MQCSKVEDDPTGQQCDPPPLQEMPAVKTDCEGGGGEAKATESVAEKIEQSGQHSSSLSNSTRSEEKLVENNNSNKNSDTYSQYFAKNCSRSVGDDRFEFGNNCEIEKISQTASVSGVAAGSVRVSDSGLLQSVGRSEVAQNSSSDQFNNLNGRVQHQNIDQFNNQQFDQQSYQFSLNQSHLQQQNNVRNRSPNKHSYNSSQHPGNFLFHQNQQQQQVSGPRGFIPSSPTCPAQQNFSTPSYYSGQHQPHPSYAPVQNGLPHPNFNSNCFQVNFQHPRHSSPYEEASESDLDNSNNNVSGPVSGSGQSQHCHQFSLRARRRVRQRVDAGEPRNSYSSIPGFSFRHQNMMSRHGGYGGTGGGVDDYTSGLYRGGPSGGVFSLRGRGRHLPGGNHPHPLPPYNTHLPFPRYRHPSLVHSHPPFPMAAAAVVHRAMLLGQGGVTAGCSTRGTVLPASGDDTKTVQSLLRDETSEKLDVLPPLSTPPTTPPLVDSENTKVKTICSESNSDPTNTSAASDNNKNNNNNRNQPSSPSIINKNSVFGENISKNALLIRELLSNKLAAVTDMMEQGFGLMAHGGPRDFSQHSLPINNNDLKENHAAQIMSHLLKVRQEMALNMSKDSDSDRHTESPGHISDNDIIEEEKDEPINLHQNGRSSAAGSGSDGEASPPSPSSDAGNSTSSNKEQKASRLENIVGGLARSTSSPLPPQGCKKRKLYQPVQHDVNEDEIKENKVKHEEPEQKKLKDGIENHFKSMQDQLAKMQEKFYNNHTNDENADPEDSELQIDLSQEDKKFNKEEITIEKRLNIKPFASIGHPLLNGSAEPLPIPPSPLNPNYMDLAKRFLQEKQDQLTKEMITRDIVEYFGSTIGKNEIAEKLKAISPELEGLADILKSELKTSLTIIVDSIVQRYLTQKRQPLGKFSENSLFNQEAKNKTPSGRAPQVRDRSTPRTIQNPVSMANPSSANSLVSSNSLVMTGSAPAPPKMSFPTLGVDGPKPLSMMSMYPSLNGQISDDEKEDEFDQDDALNLTVTPKKKRHKVTDTRITPRTVSRLLGEQPNIADLHKHFGPGGPFMAPGFLPRPPFPGLPGSFLPNIPTSLNPSLSHPDHFPFSPFGFPGPLNRPRDLSPPSSRPRSASPPRDTRPPPPLLHPAILAAQSPDFPHMRHNEDRPSSEAGSDDLKMEFGNSPFSLGNMSGKSDIFCLNVQNANCKLY